jgi:hypothetical protein
MGHPLLLDRTTRRVFPAWRRDYAMSIHFTEIILAASILGLAVGFAVL